MKAVLVVPLVGLIETEQVGRGNTVHSLLEKEPLNTPLSQSRDSGVHTPLLGTELAAYAVTR